MDLPAKCVPCSQAERPAPAVHPQLLLLVLAPLPRTHSSSLRCPKLPRTTPAPRRAGQSHSTSSLCCAWCPPGHCWLLQNLPPARSPVLSRGAALQPLPPSFHTEAGFALPRRRISLGAAQFQTGGGCSAPCSLQLSLYGLLPAQHHRQSKPLVETCWQHPRGAPNLPQACPGCPPPSWGRLGAAEEPQREGGQRGAAAPQPGHREPPRGRELREEET